MQFFKWTIHQNETYIRRPHWGPAFNLGGVCNALFKKRLISTNFRNNHRRCSAKKVFPKNSQNSHKNCTRDSFLIKLQVYRCNFIKKEFLAQLFSCEFCERTPFLQNTFGKLLLEFSFLSFDLSWAILLLLNTSSTSESLPFTAMLLMTREL